MAKFWGSRFESKTDNLADQFSFSISYDYKLAKYDCLVGIAHAKMLGKQSIISKTDASKIASGLNKIKKQVEVGTFKFNPKAEDIHTNIQEVLKKDIGAAADKLHTARSRNDLIVTDMKLYCKEELNDISALLTKLQKAILKFATKYKDIIVPAYTHLQQAQLVLLAHHMLAYVEMFDRDKSRVFDTLKRMDTLPLGSCALSGTTLPIDRQFVAKELGFSKVTDNSMDSVSDRDFVIETVSTLSTLAIHNSRIAEDFIIWATQEFDRIDIDGSLCTGSSIMPHKKNPDMLELIRGETGTICGNLNKLLMLMKGTPLTYNRDFQLDKPPLFESIEKTKETLGILIKLFETLKIHEQQQELISFDISQSSFFSVDIMEYLIKKNVSYREAHDIVGKIFKYIHQEAISLDELTNKDLKRFSNKLEVDVKKLLNPQMSVKMKKSSGSTNPVKVKQQLDKWKKKLNA